MLHIFSCISFTIHHMCRIEMQTLRVVYKTTPSYYVCGAFRATPSEGNRGRYALHRPRCKMDRADQNQRRSGRSPPGCVASPCSERDCVPFFVLISYLVGKKDKKEEHLRVSSLSVSVLVGKHTKTDGTFQ